MATAELPYDAPTRDDLDGLELVHLTLPEADRLVVVHRPPLGEEPDSHWPELEALAAQYARLRI